MDTNNLVNFLMWAMILFGPLIWIYLILHTLNWNRRKNLFSDSWIVFIVLLVSSFAVFFAFLIADVNFYGLLHLSLPVLFLLILIAVNTFSVAAVLNYRESKRIVSIVDNPSEETNEKTGNVKIFRTSAIVSILTIAMVISLVMFVNEISTKTKEEIKPSFNSDYTVYE